VPWHNLPSQILGSTNSPLLRQQAAINNSPFPIWHSFFVFNANVSYVTEVIKPKTNKKAVGWVEVVLRKKTLDY